MTVAKKLSIAAIAVMSSAVIGVMNAPQKASAFSIAGGGFSATDQIPFTFIDIARDATSNRVLQNQDDASVFANIGFRFRFFGRSYNQVGISSNGLLSFLGLNSSRDNTDLNQSAPVFPTLSVLWDDWNLQGAGAVYTQLRRIGRRTVFIVQWDQVSNNNPGATGTATFQAILFRDGNILLNYLSLGNVGGVAGYGGSATIGVSNGQSSRQRLQWSYNTPFSNYQVREWRSIWFRPRGGKR